MCQAVHIRIALYVLHTCMYDSPTVTKLVVRRSWASDRTNTQAPPIILISHAPTHLQASSVVIVKGWSSLMTKFSRWVHKLFFLGGGGGRGHT